jgi:hypothetical protein
MYKILGTDQREYGPVASDKVREWIAQGRANSQTMVSFEGGPWKALGTFPEFADILRSAAPPPLAQPTYVTGAATLKTSTLSNWGLACSALGFCCFPLALAGIVCSIMGLMEINKNPQSFSTSKTVPIIGLVLGLFLVVGNILLFISGAFTHILDRFPR